MHIHHAKINTRVMRKTCDKEPPFSRTCTFFQSVHAFPVLLHLLQQLPLLLSLHPPSSLPSSSL